MEDWNTCFTVDYSGLANYYLLNFYFVLDPKLYEGVHYVELDDILKDKILCFLLLKIALFKYKSPDGGILKHLESTLNIFVAVIHPYAF